MKTYNLLVLVLLCHGLQGLPLPKSNQTHYGRGMQLGCDEDEVVCSKLDSTGRDSSNECVKKMALCDDYKDCRQRGDEDSTFCTRTCKERNMIQCPKDGNCISRNKVCDGNVDCTDKWDEVGCCGPIGFSCEDENNICVPNGWKCDGLKDCLTGLDESPKAGCACDQYSEFTCTDLSKCIDLSKQCNKISDCTDGSDEVGCRFCNKETEFKCTNGSPTCIPKNKVCDGKSDCIDASEEVNCPLAVSVIERMDMTADPCEDFYRFACGGWIDSNVIPDGKNKWGPFYEVRDQVDNELKVVVTSTAQADTVAVTSLKDMFSACMDTETIESSGLGPVLAQAGPEGTFGGWPMVQDSWDSSKFDYSKEAGTARKNLNQNLLISIWVYLDDFDNNHNTIYIDQPDLALPLSMYLDLDSYADYITAYKTLMEDSASVIAREMGSQVTNEDLVRQAKEVFEFERQLALIMTPASERRNSTAMYNPMLVSELKENYHFDFDWDSYFAAVFSDTGISVTDNERVIVVQPDYFLAVQHVSTSTKVMANYLFWRSCMTLATDLTQEMRDIAFAYTSALSGTTSQPPRWQTCVSKSVGAFGFAAAHEYIKDNFDESAKGQADGMVGDLRTAFKELVGETDWMDEETQVKAMTKADLMLQLIGYPDWLPDPEQVDSYYEMAAPSNADDHLGNIIHMKGWKANQDLRTLRDEPERDIWVLHPAIVNAWYSPNLNTINFPAGILQPPFFKGDWPRFLNYGAIGMVIGHEITHGFDDQGRQYDGTGTVSPWWSDRTLEEFVGKAQCFIDQYSNYSIPELVDIIGEEDAHLNGKLTQGENIADNGGLHQAFRAYIRSVESQGEEPALPGLTDYSSEQMFFIANAQVWCEIQTPESLLGQILEHPHSPGKFRVQGPLSNSADFQREFGCPADSQMNRPEKCTLW